MLEKLGIKIGVVPIGGGWRYMQPFQDTEVRIPLQGCAGDDVNLIKLVRAFRIGNRIDIDYIMQDVADYIAAVSPDNVRKSYKKEERVRTITPLISDMRDALHKLTLTRPSLVSAYVARQRLASCINCPQNVQWKVECEPCNEEVIRMGQNVRRLGEFPEDPKLHGCRLHRVLLTAAIFLDKDLPPRHQDAPQPCWIPAAETSSSQP